MAATAQEKETLYRWLDSLGDQKAFAQLKKAKGLNRAAEIYADYRAWKSGKLTQRREAAISSPFAQGAIPLTGIGNVPGLLYGAERFAGAVGDKRSANVAALARRGFQESVAKTQTTLLNLLPSAVENLPLGIGEHLEAFRRSTPPEIEEYPTPYPEAPLSRLGRLASVTAGEAGPEIAKIYALSRAIPSAGLPATLPRVLTRAGVTGAAPGLRGLAQRGILELAGRVGHAPQTAGIMTALELESALAEGRAPSLTEPLKQTGILSLLPGYLRGKAGAISRPLPRAIAAGVGEAVEFGGLSAAATGVEEAMRSGRISDLFAPSGQKAEAFVSALPMGFAFGAMGARRRPNIKQQVAENFLLRTDPRRRFSEGEAMERLVEEQNLTPKEAAEVMARRFYSPEEIGEAIRVRPERQALRPRVTPPAAPAAAAAASPTAAAPESRRVPEGISFKKKGDLSDSEVVLTNALPVPRVEKFDSKEEALHRHKELEAQGAPDLKAAKVRGSSQWAVRYSEPEDTHLWIIPKTVWESRSKTQEHVKLKNVFGRPATPEEIASLTAPAVPGGGVTTPPTPRVDVAEAVETTQPTTEAKGATLPPDLAGAKPRYGYGNKGFQLEFESDVDKALFIVAREKPSRRDADYLSFLRGVFPGESNEQIRARGQEVKARIKEQARSAKSGTLTISATPPVAVTPPAAPAAAAAAGTLTISATPPVAEGSIRLYRGEPLLSERKSPETTRTGRWFYGSLQEAEDYIREQYGLENSRIFYVDVPVAIAERTKNIPPDQGYTLPFDLLGRVVEVPQQTRAPETVTAPTGEPPAPPKVGLRQELIDNITQTAQGGTFSPETIEGIARTFRDDIVALPDDVLQKIADHPEVPSLYRDEFEARRSIAREELARRKPAAPTQPGFAVGVARTDPRTAAARAVAPEVDDPRPRDFDVSTGRYLREVSGTRDDAEAGLSEMSAQEKTDTVLVQRGDGKWSAIGVRLGSGRSKPSKTVRYNALALRLRDLGVSGEVTTRLGEKLTLPDDALISKEHRLLGKSFGIDEEETERFRTKMDEEIARQAEAEAKRDEAAQAQNEGAAKDYDKKAAESFAAWRKANEGVVRSGIVPQDLLLVKAGYELFMGMVKRGAAGLEEFRRRFAERWQASVGTHAEALKRADEIWNKSRKRLSDDSVDKGALILVALRRRKTDNYDNWAKHMIRGIGPGIQRDLPGLWIQAQDSAAYIEIEMKEAEARLPDIQRAVREGGDAGEFTHFELESILHSVGQIPYGRAKDWIVAHSRGDSPALRPQGEKGREFFTRGIRVSKPERYQVSARGASLIMELLRDYRAAQRARMLNNTAIDMALAQVVGSNGLSPSTIRERLVENGVSSQDAASAVVKLIKNGWLQEVIGGGGKPTNTFIASAKGLSLGLMTEHTVGAGDTVRAYSPREKRYVTGRVVSLVGDDKLPLVNDRSEKHRGFHVTDRAAYLIKPFVGDVSPLTDAEVNSYANAVLSIPMQEPVRKATPEELEAGSPRYVPEPTRTSRYTLDEFLDNSDLSDADKARVAERVKERQMGAAQPAAPSPPGESPGQVAINTARHVMETVPDRGQAAGILRRWADEADTNLKYGPDMGSQLRYYADLIERGEPLTVPLPPVDLRFQVEQGEPFSLSALDRAAQMAQTGGVGLPVRRQPPVEFSTQPTTPPEIVYAEARRLRFGTLQPGETRLTPEEIEQKYPGYLEFERQQLTQRYRGRTTAVEIEQAIPTVAPTQARAALAAPRTIPITYHVPPEGVVGYMGARLDDMRDRRGNISRQKVLAALLDAFPDIPKDRMNDLSLGVTEVLRAAADAGMMAGQTIAARFIGTAGFARAREALRITPRPEPLPLTESEKRHGRFLRGAAEGLRRAHERRVAPGRAGETFTAEESEALERDVAAQIAAESQPPPKAQAGRFGRGRTQSGRVLIPSGRLGLGRGQSGRVLIPSSPAVAHRARQILDRMSPAHLMSSPRFRKFVRRNVTRAREFVRGRNINVPFSDTLIKREVETLGYTGQQAQDFRDEMKAKGGLNLVDHLDESTENSAVSAAERFVPAVARVYYAGLSGREVADIERRGYRSLMEKGAAPDGAQVIATVNFPDFDATGRPITRTLPADASGNPILGAYKPGVIDPMTGEAADGVSLDSWSIKAVINPDLPPDQQAHYQKYLELYNATRRAFDEAWADASRSGVKLENGDPLPYEHWYFPRNMDYDTVASLMKNTSSADRLIAKLEAKGYSTEEIHALLGHAKHPLQRRNASLEMSRILKDVPEDLLLNDNLVEQAENYLYRAALRSEHVARFGQSLKKPEVTPEGKPQIKRVRDEIDRQMTRLRLSSKKAGDPAIYQDTFDALSLYFTGRLPPQGYSGRARGEALNFLYDISSLKNLGLFTMLKQSLSLPGVLREVTPTMADLTTTEIGGAAVTLPRMMVEGWKAIPEATRLSLARRAIDSMENREDFYSRHSATTLMSDLGEYRRQVLGSGVLGRGLRRLEGVPVLGAVKRTFRGERLHVGAYAVPFTGREVVQAADRGVRILAGRLFKSHTAALFEQWIRSEQEIAPPRVEFWLRHAGVDTTDPRTRAAVREAGKGRDAPLNRLIDRTAFRMTEKNVARGDPWNLPINFNTPLGRLVSFFRRVTLQESAALKDFIVRPVMESVRKHGVGTLKEARFWEGMGGLLTWFLAISAMGYGIAGLYGVNRGDTDAFSELAETWLEGVAMSGPGQAIEAERGVAARLSGEEGEFIGRDINPAPISDVGDVWFGTKAVVDLMLIANRNGDLGALAKDTVLPGDLSQGTAAAMQQLEESHGPKAIVRLRALIRGVDNVTGGAGAVIAPRSVRSVPDLREAREELRQAISSGDTGQMKEAAEGVVDAGGSERQAANMLIRELAPAFDLWNYNLVEGSRTNARWRRDGPQVIEQRDRLRKIWGDVLPGKPFPALKLPGQGAAARR